MPTNNYVFIMAGGIGSRFWPKSRNKFPKQFLDILGIGKSLLQLTYDRFRRLCPADNIYIVTNTQYAELVAEQLLGIPSNNIIKEPSRNNTAPCIAYATYKILSKDPDACMVIAPSDHFILHEERFLEKVKHAITFASSNNALLTLGIQPTRPDTGYGYINFEKNGNSGVYPVKQFTEKPDYQTAVSFLDNGSYVWNAGIFIWTAKNAAAAFRKHCPEISALFEKGLDMFNTNAEQGFIDKNYPLSPNISIDYAIMEKADNVFTIPADFGWSDLGTWASLFVAGKKNPDNNFITWSGIQLKNTKNCIIHIPKDKMAVIKGLEDYIVVDDKDVLLIYPKKDEQEIKQITEALKRDGQEKFL